MTPTLPDPPKIFIRPVQYRDVERLESLMAQTEQDQQPACSVSFREQVQQVRRWYGLLKFLSWFPNPFQHQFAVYVAEAQTPAESETALRGFVQVSPFNNSRSTWRVERSVVASEEDASEMMSDPKGVGSQLLRYCFEAIWEARTWVLEVNIHQKETLALYRQNGFQPLAQLTYWSLASDLLADLAGRDPDLPNLLPVSNADAQLLYQLDCVSMPPLLRQVFDRHFQDFKTRFLVSCIDKVQQWLHRREVVRGYVFEPQRKAAIGYFQLISTKDGSRPHQAQLTVHPAYTWLYPKLLAKMAQIVQNVAPQSLELSSADYQHEREEYLEKLGAQRVEHTLLMSRSVWHKLKEAKQEGLAISEMLQKLQPVGRTPIPSRMSWSKNPLNPSSNTPEAANGASFPTDFPSVNNGHSTSAEPADVQEQKSEK